MGFNPTSFTWDALPIQGEQVAGVSSAVAEMLEGALEALQAMLREEAADLCKSAEETYRLSGR